MFSESVGNLLQLLALLLELVGISLAAIELRFPHIAEFIMKNQKTSNDVSWWGVDTTLKELYRGSPKLEDQLNTKKFSRIFLFVYYGLVVVLVGSVYWDSALSMSSDMFLSLALILIAPFLVVLIAPLFMYSSTRLILLSRYISKDRSLGTLGLFLALIGLLLEVYQVLTVAFSPQPSILSAPLPAKALVITATIILLIFVITLIFALRKAIRHFTEVDTPYVSADP